MERISLSEEQRAELQALTRSRHGSAAVVRRARCILLWAAGERRVDIRDKLACNDSFITRWTRAYADQGLPGLVSYYPGRAPAQPVEKLEAGEIDGQPREVDDLESLHGGVGHGGCSTTR